MRKLKNAAESGMTARKIIVVPCIVNSWLYISAEMSLPLGVASWARSTAASRPPNTKKNRPVMR